MPPRLVSGEEHWQDAGSSSDDTGRSYFGQSSNHGIEEALATEERVERRQTNNTTPNERRNNRFCNACVIQDNSPVLTYAGGWTLFNERSRGTTHRTISQEASVSFSFNGSQVWVFGTVPKGNQQTKGPTARYILDDVPVLLTTLPVSNSDIRNQPFFAARDLNLSVHSLKIEMVRVNPKAPYILQHFFVKPHDLSGDGGGVELPNDQGGDVPETGEGDTGTADATKSYQPSMTSAPDYPSGQDPDKSEVPDAMQIVRILAAVLGTVVGLVILSVILFFIYRKFLKLHPTEEKPKPKPQPWWSKYFRLTPQRRRPETMFTNFTTSDSILRNEPNTLQRGSSAWTRSDGRSEFFRASTIPLPINQGPFYVPARASKTGGR